MKKFHGLVCHFSSISRFDIDLFFSSASLQVFATIFTCIFGGILGEYLGRKTVCSIGSPIFLASFLCVTFAPSMHLLFFGQVVLLIRLLYVDWKLNTGTGRCCPWHSVLCMWGKWKWKKSLIRANSRPDLHQRGNYTSVEDDAQLWHQLLCHPWHGDCLHPWQGDKAEVDCE